MSEESEMQTYEFDIELLAKGFIVREAVRATTDVEASFEAHMAATQALRAGKTQADRLYPLAATLASLCRGRHYGRAEIMAVALIALDLLEMIEAEGAEEAVH